MMNDHRYRSNEIPDYEELNGGGADDQSDQFNIDSLCDDVFELPGEVVVTTVAGGRLEL